MKLKSEHFNRLVSEAIDELPEEVQEKMHNVAILVEDDPTPEQYEKRKVDKNTLLLGLFEGFMQSRRINVGPVLPDRITLFRNHILELCSTEEDVKRQILRTLRHEIAHHFGSDERGARRSEKK